MSAQIIAFPAQKSRALALSAVTLSNKAVERLCRQALFDAAQLLHAESSVECTMAKGERRIRIVMKALELLKSASAEMSRYARAEMELNPRQ